MFRSATLRLTGWYLLVLISLSLVFSVVIYQVASSEIVSRIDNFQIGLQEFNDFSPSVGKFALLRSTAINQAHNNIITELFYVNLFVLIVGGFGSYYLARRSLLPIERVHESQSRFTSDASHELRTPLAVMKMELEFALRDKDATVTSLKEVLSSSLEEVDKLSNLSEMLLNLSQLNHNKLKMKSVNLNRITRSLVNKYNQQQNRIKLTTSKNMIVNGNETAITELIKVLIDNALKYSPEGSEITIRLSKYDNQAKFEIQNYGPGICADKLPFIFDRFFRADSSRTNEQHKGYGLGLALAKSIVELHNGELIVSSTPDVETVFTFILSLRSKVQAKVQN